MYKHCIVNVSLFLIIKLKIHQIRVGAWTLQTNTFITSDKPVYGKGQTPSVLKTTTLVLEMNVFCSGDEHFSTGEVGIENVCSNFIHTPTAGYQQILNRTFVKMITTHRYSLPKTGGYHVAEIHMVSKCTTVSSIALKDLQKHQRHTNHNQIF